MNNIGERIKLLRTKRKLSQADLARILGVSRSAISSYENGTRKPDQDTLIGIASCFQVSVDYLLGCDTSQYETPGFTPVLKEIGILLNSSSLPPSEKEIIINEVRDFLKWKLEKDEHDD
ncbi:MAG: helix-turn-helix transcriptional regulator [Syntrophomonas sp.]